MASIVLTTCSGAEQIRVSLCAPEAFLAARPTSQMWADFYNQLCQVPPLESLEQARAVAGSDARVFARTLTGFVECDERGIPFNPCFCKSEIESF